MELILLNCFLMLTVHTDQKMLKWLTEVLKYDANIITGT